MSRWHPVLAGTLALALAAGCSRHVPAPPGGGAEGKSKSPLAINPQSADQAAGSEKKRPAKPRRPANPAVSATREAGVISGRVRWQWAPPALADTIPAAAGQTVLVNGEKVPARPSPRLRVSADDRGIAGAVVWLENPPPDEAADPGDDPEVRQREGDFHPHVQAARTGARLRLASADDRADFRATGALSFSVPLSRGKQEFRPLNRAGLVEVRSEVYPWASAYLWVFGHRYYATTGGDGRFRLPAVPPGKYQLVLWHEGWRAPDPLGAKVTVTLGKDEGRSVEWTLK
jgi:hypothetical protein